MSLTFWFNKLNDMRFLLQQLLTPNFIQSLPPSGERNYCNKNFVSVCTLKQIIRSTSRGFTNIKSNWNVSRSNWRWSPVHEYWLNQSICTLSMKISEGERFFPKVGEWVTRHVHHSMGAYSSAYNYCTLFNNPNSHRTVESLVMTCSENGHDLFQANLDSSYLASFVVYELRSNFMTSMKPVFA